MATVDIRPQPGAQEAFLKSSADITIYGGAAGGGKSYALLLEPLRHVANKDFGALVLRRTTPEITNVGGLWTTAEGHLPADWSNAEDWLPGMGVPIRGKTQVRPLGA